MASFAKNAVCLKIRSQSINPLPSPPCSTSADFKINYLVALHFCGWEVAFKAKQKNLFTKENQNQVKITQLPNLQAKKPCQ